MTFRRAAWISLLQIATLAIVCPIVKKPIWVIPLVVLGVGYVSNIWFQAYSEARNRSSSDE